MDNSISIILEHLSRTWAVLCCTKVSWSRYEFSTCGRTAGFWNDWVSGFLWMWKTGARIHLWRVGYLLPPVVHLPQLRSRPHLPHTRQSFTSTAHNLPVVYLRRGDAQVVGVQGHHRGAGSQVEHSHPESQQRTTNAHHLQLFSLILDVVCFHRMRIFTDRVVYQTGLSFADKRLLLSRLEGSFVRAAWTLSMRSHRSKDKADVRWRFHSSWYLESAFDHQGQ